jgi:hypothetical protein
MGGGALISPYFVRSKKYPKVKSDPQRHLVYQAERDLLGPCIESVTATDTLEAVITHACNKYRIRRPKLKVGNLGKGAYGWCTDEEICLNSNHHGANLLTLLHELAHWVVDEVIEYADDIEGVHGPEFVSFYMHLLEGYKVMPMKCSALLFEGHGVRWDPGLVSPFKTGRK